MVIFNSYVSHYQRVNHTSIPTFSCRNLAAELDPPLLSDFWRTRVQEMIRLEVVNARSFLGGSTWRRDWDGEKKNYGFVGKRIEKRIYLLESLELNLTFLYVFLILLFNYFFIFFGGQVTMSFRHFFSKRKTRWVSPKQKVCFPKRTTKSRWFPELSRAAPTPFPTQAAGDSPRWPMTWRCLPSPKSSGGFDNSWGSATGTTHGAGIDGMEPQAGIIYECFLSLNFYVFINFNF